MKPRRFELAIEGIEYYDADEMDAWLKEIGERWSNDHALLMSPYLHPTKDCLTCQVIKELRDE